MNVKTDTKEKFHVITVQEPALTASMTDDLAGCLFPYLQNDARLPDSQVKNIVLDLGQVKDVDPVMGEKLVYIQQKFYEQNVSFVICALQPAVEDFFDQHELLEMMNVTPTVSEAGDIVQMEEIEREFLKEE